MGSVVASEPVRNPLDKEDEVSVTAAVGAQATTTTGTAGRWRDMLADTAGGVARAHDHD